MIHTHLTPDELVMIEAYAKINQSVARTAQLLNCSRQTIYLVYAFLKKGHIVLDYYQNYKKNKPNCGRHRIVLPVKQAEYVRTKIVRGWDPDVIIVRDKFPIDCSVCTLYRVFRTSVFDLADLPMKGKREPNGYQEKRKNKPFTAQFVNEQMTTLPLQMNLVTLKVTSLSMRNTKVRSLL